MIEIPDDVDAAFVTAVLEDAGRTLIALPMPKNGMPAELRAGWPDVVHDFAEAYGWLTSAEDNRPARPSVKAIRRMDMAYDWLWLVSDVRKRRIVFARSLVHPISDKHRFSYYRLARMSGMHPETIRQWHKAGVEEIARSLLAKIAKCA